MKINHTSLPNSHLQGRRRHKIFHKKLHETFMPTEKKAEMLNHYHSRKRTPTYKRMSRLLLTVWKFHDFCVTQILREINF